MRTSKKHNDTKKCFYLWPRSAKQFCKNVAEEILLQPLIMYRWTRFVLNGVAFLFLKDVLDLWYSGYFLFLAMGKLWKQQEENAS